MLEFCIRAAVSTTQLSKPIESLLKKNTRRSLQRNLVEHMFSVYIELVSTVVEDVKKDRKVHLTLRWMNTINQLPRRLVSNSKACTPVFLVWQVNVHPLQLGP